jgi:hypothetical protein
MKRPDGAEVSTYGIAGGRIDGVELGRSSQSAAAVNGNLPLIHDWLENMG